MEVLKLKILDFKYNGKYLSDFGFKVAKTIDNTFGLNREIVVGNINTIRNKPNHYGVKYTNTLPLKYLIMKDPCTNNSQGKLTIKENELREIQRWLTSPKTPKCFTLNKDDNNVREYYGVFTEVEPYEYGDLYGITVTFTCNAPYGFDKNIVTTSCETTIDLAIDNPTDELCEYIYPIIKITPNQCTTFSIQNKSDNNNIMTFNFDSIYNEIEIDCDNQRIIADGILLNLDEVGWSVYEITDYNNVNSGIFNLYWLRFVPNVNELTISGNGDFIIEYKTPVKVGGYY